MRLPRFTLGRSQVVGLVILAALIVIPLVASAQSQDDIMRLRSIVDRPMKNLYVAGWAVMAVGLLIGTGWEQLKVFAGQPPNHGQVIARTLVAAAALAIYSPFVKSVWNISSDIAASITDTTDLEALGLGMRTMCAQAFTALFKDGIVFAPVSLVRNAILGFFMDFMMWGVSFVIDGIRLVQVSVFNVVFLFGPIALGLHVMGFRTGQLWLTALLEICTWNITIAIVTYGVSRRMADQFLKNAQMGAFQIDWWRDMKEITFLAMLIMFVPAITSRFFGFAALGELSKAALGANTSMAIGTTLLGWGGSSAAVRMQDQSTLGDGSDRNDRRAGD